MTNIHSIWSLRKSIGEKTTKNRSIFWEEFLWKNVLNEHTYKSFNSLWNKKRKKIQTHSVGHYRRYLISTLCNLSSMIKLGISQDLLTPLKKLPKKDVQNHINWGNIILQ